MLKVINWALIFFNLKLVQTGKGILPFDMEKDFMGIHKRAQPYSMVLPERLYATYQAIQ